MSRLTAGLLLALSATTPGAQDTKPGQSHTPAVGGANETRPFLFDGRMRATAFGSERSLTIIAPMLVLSSHHKQASLAATDESSYSIYHSSALCRLRALWVPGYVGSWLTAIVCPS